VTSKFALVIANTEYQDASFAKLTAPGKDADEFAQVLRDAELAAFDDVQVLLNDVESKIRRSIARFFADRKRDDLLLLYFSGHGIRNGQGQLFLAANDTEISILEATGIPADFITYAMNNSRSQRQLLILDCCNSGAFAHGSKSAAAVGQSMGMATAFEGSGFGRGVLTATDATQYAWEGDKVIGNTQKSVFTHFLIEGLKGDADRDGDGRIHVDELYDYAYEQVVRRTPKQTPGKWSYKQQGDIVLRENLRPRDVKPAPLPPDLLELLSHPNSGVRKVGVQELISLLEGKHLGLTRAAEEKLREICANDDSFTLRKTAGETLTAHGFTLEQTAPPVVMPLIVPVETTIPREEKSEIEKSESQAIPYNLKGELRPKPVTGIPQAQIAKPAFKKAISSRLLGFAAGGLLVIVLLIWGASGFLRNPPAATPELTSTSQSNLMPASQLSATVTDQPIKTETALPTQISIPLTQTATPSSSTLGIGSTMISEKDGMILLYVPAGEFIMGSNDGKSDEKPAHKANLSAFWIDQTEVTNAMYLKCVREEKCNEPRRRGSYTEDYYFYNPQKGNYPVIYVSWGDAKSYCEWVDRRLPTEAEWEKAARGKDGRIYPWGNDFPGSTSYFDLLGYNQPDTSEVGKSSKGVSVYGVFNLAGNVWEWTADWYSDTFYQNPPPLNPLGPEKGEYRVLRGGSWYSILRAGNKYYFDGLRSSNRFWMAPNDSTNDVGFRCAMSATP
jgi:formylglycine-generating enzyme required for sulfatase activity/uncharacterized caspase-like protein